MRIAILGIGNELNGDDAAGVLVARAVKALLAGRDGLPEWRGAFLVIEAGPAPESFTGPLRRFQPDEVLLVDAAELGQPPGAFAWIDWDQAGGMSASTHTLPPSVLSRFLAEELDCRVTLVGIQPVHLDFDRPVSQVVLAAVERVAGEIMARYG